MMKNLVALAFLTILTTNMAFAGVCDQLFSYSDGQVMNEVDASKARVITKFDLLPGADVEGALERQVMSLVSEYGATTVAEGLADNDDEMIMVTIAQNKRTRRLFTVVQMFMGDTETGKVFSLYSSQELAELGDGECRDN